jgi:hypothetical protein
LAFSICGGLVLGIVPNCLKLYFELMRVNHFYRFSDTFFISCYLIFSALLFEGEIQCASRLSQSLPSF